MITVKLFPKILGIFKNENHYTYSDILISDCYSYKEKNKISNNSFLSGVYNSNQYNLDLYKNNNFKELFDWVENCLKQYCEHLKINSNISKKHCFFNIYHQYDYQEYHNHSDVDISAIYYLKGDVKSAQTRFTDFEFEKHKLDIKEYTEDNSPEWYVPFEEGKLIIFRSDTLHCVERHNLKTDRISLAFNFNLSKK
jgi:uncharacterized protein (TIGR02466 family)